MIKPEDKSNGMKSEQEQDDAKPMTFSPEQKEFYNFYQKRFDQARMNRDGEFEEFDDMTYEDDYIESRRALLTYLKRKQNDDEVRVNTPTTEKRVEFVANELLGMNLVSEVISFDQDDVEYIELGRSFTDVIKRTNEIEMDQQKELEIVFELLSQRILYIEELWRDETWGKKKIKRCEKRFVNGLQIYVADLSIPSHRFNEQPFIVKYEVKSYDEAKKTYGTWDNWKNVQSGPATNNSNGYDYLFNYRFKKIQSNQVEIIHYMSTVDNEYMIMIDGVLMFDEPQALPAWWNMKYNISAIVMKPIPGFHYGKSLISSAKTLQALENETIRNLIRKFRQALEPPLGVKSGKIYSRDIWMPGAVVSGVKADDFSRLIDHDGVTPSEMGMYNLINQKVLEFIGTQSGTTPTKRMTAQEVMRIQKEAMKMLGLSVLAWMTYRKLTDQKRLDNILYNWTKPQGKRLDKLTNQVENTYKSFSIKDGQTSDSKIGKKVVQFMDKPLNEDDISNVYQYEKENNLKFTFVNVKILAELELDFHFEVVNKERDSSELSKALFREKLGQAAEISQIIQVPISGDTVMSEYEKTWGLKDMFQKDKKLPPPAPGEAPAQGGDKKSGMNVSLNALVGKAEGVNQ